MLRSELFDDVFFARENSPSKKLDIVYTFVDVHDKTWKIKYEKYNGKRFDSYRYDDSHIVFSLETINKYFDSNLIDKIYIVCDYHRLNLDQNNLKKIYNKIVYIDHDDIIPKKYLPTFNSMVIEAFLWNIPNLSDNFLYFNDDLFLSNYVSKNDFFQGDIPIQFFHGLGNSSHPWYKNIKSSNQLFEKKFQTYVGVCPQHATYHIMTKKLRDVFNIFESDLSFMFSNHKTRKYDSHAHNLIFLYGMYTYYKKLAINKRTSFSHIFNFTDTFIEKTKSLSGRKKFYAISSKIKKDQIDNFKQFKHNVLN